MAQLESASSDPKPSSASLAHVNYLGLIPPAIVVAALYFGRPVLMPLAIAILLAFALAPLVRGLRKLGVGRVASVLLSGVWAILLLLAIGAFIGTQAVQVASDLPNYQPNIERKIEAIRGTTLDRGFVARAASFFKDVREQIAGAPPAGRNNPRLETPRRDSSAVPVEVREPEPQPVELFLMFTRPLLWPLAIAGIVLVFVIFILLHKEDIRDRFIRLAGSRDMQRTSLLLDEGAVRLSRFLLAQSAVNAGFGIWLAGWFWWIGIPSPLLWGLSAMILRFAPYVGVPLVALPPLALAFAADPGWSMFVWTLLIFIASEIVVSQGIEPWLFGRKVGLSPVAIVVAATFWTWLWGPVGLLLSTPMTMCLVVLGRHIEHLEFLDVLLGDRPALSADEALYLRMLGDDADEAAVEAEAFLKENSLCRYYDDVVLKALGLAQADINRGALDHDRVVKIHDAIRTLMDDLSDFETANAANQDVDIATVDQPADYSVLCVAGRGPLDEAGAALLINLLSEIGISARLVSSNEVSAARIEQLDVKGAKVAVLCYLDPGSFARPRYVLRRLRRRVPNLIPIAAFWAYPGNKSQAAELIGGEIVTNLENAVEKISAALAANRQAPTRSRSRDERVGGKTGALTSS